MSQILFMSTCWLLAAVFGLALQHKLGQWPRFTAALAAYQLLPASALKLGAILLTASELLVAVGLLLLQGWALPAAALLLSLYGVAIAVNLLRGRTQIDCGCGDEPTPLSITLLARNGLLAALALWQWVTVSDAAPAAAVAPMTVVLSIATALVALGIYASVNQLLANQGRYQRLWLTGAAAASQARSS